MPQCHHFHPSAFLYYRGKYRGRGAIIRCSSYAGCYQNICLDLGFSVDGAGFLDDGDGRFITFETKVKDSREVSREDRVDLLLTTELV